MDGCKNWKTLTIDNSSILSNFGFLGKFIDDVFIKEDLQIKNL